MITSIDPRASIFAAIEAARVNAGVDEPFIELEIAVINDLLDRVRVPRPAEPSEGAINRCMHGWEN
jgi:hypothetical protein